MLTKLTIGDVTVQRIVEQTSRFDALQFFPSLTSEILAENAPWLQPECVDMNNQIVLCIQSYVVRTPHHVILIDTCVGNNKPRPARLGDPPSWDQMIGDRYEQNLAAAGVSVDEIDFVMCTHMHVDHVGWNTRLTNGRWVPTFPKARYIFSERELAYWTERESRNVGDVPWITDSVLPVVAARRADLVASDHAFDDTVHLLPTPGHTIDHYSVRIGRPGADVIIAGDMIHSPLQARYPDIGMFADFSSSQATDTRRRLFNSICETSTTFCSGHFPGRSTGHIRRHGNAFDFVPGEL